MEGAEKRSIVFELLEREWNARLDKIAKTRKIEPEDVMIVCILSLNNEVRRLNNEIKKFNDELRRINAELSGLVARAATKKDIKMMATKEDIKMVVTKEDIKMMTTKEDVRWFKWAMNIGFIAIGILVSMLGSLFKFLLGYQKVNGL